MMEQTDDGGLLRPALRLPGRRLAAPGNRVRFGPTAFAVGYGVAALVLAAIATAAVGWGTSPDFWGYAWIAVIAAFYAAGLGLPTAVPVGIALGLALRPVASQWLHVLAFFAVPALLTWLAVALAVRSVFVPLLMGLAVGVSAALGRAAVWRLVTVG
ncbi:hypothetical protein BN1051_00173 [Arthrobacter saudimassiliensis]|uniref:Uncharacterized protein n=1 Tax=Arthrobacter saudimassiliensis TaxID=1461584 RepID=A0A078MKQ8_9MICC|nr:hypothetical protein BN1051_00173 [Arthrobacter saudimassiliensis]